MPPLIPYLIRRLFSILATLIIITAILYAGVMLTPAETRATLHMPKKTSPRMTEEQYQAMIERMIEKYHLNDPYPVQYFYWLTNLVQGNWGYSPTMQESVLTAVLRRTPVTAELTLYSILAFIPLGLISGVIAGSKRDRAADQGFRFAAFVAASFPAFILALILLSLFYVQLRWFAPERLTMWANTIVKSDDFRLYTGLLTIDGFLNGRADISLDALRHLVLPVFTLAISHWATLGRITRTSMVEELEKDYVVAAKAHGIPTRRIVWHHTLRNAVAPALTSSLLSAAALVTGVFVVEIIYNFHGISEIAVTSMQFVPDAAAAMGFALYSVLVVLILMSILDLILFALDPRLRHGI